MKIRKRDGAYDAYDESKVRAAVMGAGVPIRTAAKVARTARRPLTVAKVGGLTETAMMRAGRHRACRPCIEYRSKRRQERIRRACVIWGVIDETLKHVKPSTLEMLRDADPDMHKAISHIVKAVRSKPKDPPYTHLRIILGGNSEDHLSILRDSFPTGSLRRRGW